MNLLLTCSTIPEFDAASLELWKKFCVVEWIPGIELVSYLKFAPKAEYALIDAIVFLEPNMAIGFAERPDGTTSLIPEISPWDAHALNAGIAEQIRRLPESCAMRDGRKWKRIPQIVLTKHGPMYRHLYMDLDVEFVRDVTEEMLYFGYASPSTWNKIEAIINRYHLSAMSEYERVGFLVTIDRGLYRVKRAFRKKNANESEFYYGGKDKRTFRGFVTFGRDPDGASYQAQLFEMLLNDPSAGEQEFHRFFEEHPIFLAEAFMGVPISHRPRFTSNNQVPDFSIAPALPRDTSESLKLLELKGPEASVLGNRRYLHRGLAQDVIQALAQVRDYSEYIREPLNFKSIEQTLGYVPTTSQQAVLIGRTPPVADAELWEKRKAEQPSVRIVTYDELL